LAEVGGNWYYKKHNIAKNINPKVLHFVWGAIFFFGGHPKPMPG